MWSAAHPTTFPLLNQFLSAGEMNLTHPIYLLDRPQRSNLMLQYFKQLKKYRRQSCIIIEGGLGVIMYGAFGIWHVSLDWFPYRIDDYCSK